MDPQTPGDEKHWQGEEPMQAIFEFATPPSAALERSAMDLCNGCSGVISHAVSTDSLSVVYDPTRISEEEIEQRFVAGGLDLRIKEVGAATPAPPPPANENVKS